MSCPACRLNAKASSTVCFTRSRSGKGRSSSRIWHWGTLCSCEPARCHQGTAAPGLVACRSGGDRGVLAGYYGFYLIMPNDIEWHLRSSLDRLFLHLWPAAVFVLFYAVSSPVHSGERELGQNCAGQGQVAGPFGRPAHKPHHAAVPQSASPKADASPIQRRAQRGGFSGTGKGKRKRRASKRSQVSRR